MTSLTADRSGDDYVSIADETKRTIEIVLPWMISVLAHFAIALLAFFFVWTISVKESEERIVPSLASVVFDVTKPLAMSTADMDSFSVPMPALPPVQRSEGCSGLPKWPMGSGTADTPPGFDLELGIHSPPSVSIPIGGLTGYATSMFPAVPGPPPRSIVFVVDASGSIIDLFRFITNELSRSIRNLSVKQKFTVIFFQRGEAIELSPYGLKRATDTSKRSAVDWLSADNVVPGGASNPLAAMRRALGYKPDVIYLLSDNITGVGTSAFELDSARLRRFIKDLNRSKARICTTQFVYADETGTMRRIAGENNGVYRYITDVDLGLR